MKLLGKSKIYLGYEMQLRPYQSKATNAAKAFLRGGRRVVIIVI